MLKLSKYQVFITLILLFLFITFIQIIARPIITSIDLEANDQQNLVFFWINIFFIIFSVFVLLLQSFLYKFVCKLITGRNQYLFGYSLFILLFSVIPMKIVNVLFIFLSEDTFSHLSTTLTFSISEVIINSLIYSILLYLKNVFSTKHTINFLFIILVINFSLNFFHHMFRELVISLTFYENIMQLL